MLIFYVHQGMFLFSKVYAGQWLTVFNSKYDHSFKHDFLYHVFYSVTEGVNFKWVVQNVTTEKEYYVLESFYQNVIVVSWCLYFTIITKMVCQFSNISAISWTVVWNLELWFNTLFHYRLWQQRTKFIYYDLLCFRHQIMQWFCFLKIHVGHWLTIVGFFLLCRVNTATVLLKKDLPAKYNYCSVMEWVALPLTSYCVFSIRFVWGILESFWLNNVCLFAHICIYIYIYKIYIYIYYTK